MKETDLYYVGRRFRKLTDEQVGRIQHLLFDEGKTIRELAAEYNVSKSLIGVVKSAVPSFLVEVNLDGLQRFRRGKKLRSLRAKKTA